jgi:hypothetical protein
MRKSAAALLVLALALVASRAAGEPDDATRIAGAIAPFVDHQTLALVHIDLGGIDAVESIALLARLLRLNEQQRAQVQGAVAPLSVLPTHGSADVFVVVSMSDLVIADRQGNSGQPAKLAGLPCFLVVSVADGAPGRALAVELKRGLGRDAVMESIGQAIVLGSPQTLDRLKTRPPQARPEIAAALRAVDGGAAQVLLVPPREVRQLVELMWPRLPESLGGGLTKTFTRGLAWAAVGVDLPPAAPELRMVVQSESPESAQALAREISALAERLAEREIARQELPRFSELWQHLAPRVSGDRLEMTVNEKQTRLTECGTFLSLLLRMAIDNRPSPAN